MTGEGNLQQIEEYELSLATSSENDRWVFKYLHEFLHKNILEWVYWKLIIYWNLTPPRHAAIFEGYFDPFFQGCSSK